MKEIVFGNMLNILPLMDENSVDAIITDPPYGLKFMGKKWDYDVPTVKEWEQCLRVLKPGGYLLSFAGTRTQHRMATNIEDAGFEIRDMIAWVYGSGFPKSLDIGKSIDNKFGIDRKVVGKRKHPTLKNTDLLEEQANASHGNNLWSREWNITEPTSDEAKEYEGWGSALKPALEPITMARKPLSEKTIAENILKWGVGGINIDECRVDTYQDGELERLKKRADSPRQDFTGGRLHSGAEYTPQMIESGMSKKGRFPANFIHDGDQLVLDLFPNNAGAAAPVSKGMSGKSKGIYGDFGQKGDDGKTFRNDSGSAARFFYCAKSSRSERNLGCDDLPESHFQMRPFAEEGCDQSVLKNRMNSKAGKNNHPTVKPIKLMQYLIKLVSKKGSVILDPYCGSGTTALACIIENREYIAIDREKAYYEMTKIRSEYLASHPEIIKKFIK